MENLSTQELMAPHRLIGAIRKKYPDLPIHVHSHDTAGIAVSSMLAAAEAGADVVDVAIDSMSGVTSQPAMGAVCAALEQTNLGTGIKYADIQALNLYWSQVRMLYTCFEANVRASDSSVFDHEMPGGQYTNLMVSDHGRMWRPRFDGFACLVPSFATWSWYSVVRYV
jgi:pyruvate carboxylase